MKEIMWRGEPIPIRIENLRLLIVKANDTIFEISNLRNTRGLKLEKLQPLYDRVSIHFADAMKIIKNEGTLNPKARQMDVKSIQYLEEFIDFCKEEQIFQRNLDIANSLEDKLEKQDSKDAPKADEVVRVYELLIFNVTNLSLCKKFDDKELKKYTSLQISFKAIRCYYVGMTYLSAEKWAEAIALFKKSETQIRIAAAHFQNRDDIDSVQKFVDKLNHIIKKASGNIILAHARGLLDKQKKKLNQISQQTEPQNDKEKLLIDNQEEFTSFAEDNRKLIKFPPVFEPIPCKPLFLDLALGGCYFPDLTERKKAPKKGFLSGWWG